MILLTLCCLCFVASQCYGNEYPNSLSLHDNYKAFWRFDNESKVFHFKVEVKNVTGWIAFGVSRLLYRLREEQQWNRNQMEYYDVVVGGIYDNKTTYFQDYLTDGHKAPKLDEKQDWTLDTMTEVSGVTTMIFHRQQNTSDTEGDNVIEPGRRRIVWSYHSSSDETVNKTAWLQHTENGFKEIALLETPKEKPEVEYYKTETPTTGAGMIAASVIGNLLIIINVVIFFY